VISVKSSNDYTEIAYLKSDAFLGGDEGVCASFEKKSAAKFQL
jgi:hypothetical protein